MVVRQSPGVYANEIDKSLGLQLLGTGGIGIAAKLNKGIIGKPFTVISPNNLVEVCGKPIPSFNMVGWHSINNLLIYSGAVGVSRVEKLEHTSKHNSIKQKFGLPVSSAQVGVTLTGNAIPFNFNNEFQMMLKNRIPFKSVNENNQFDVLNPDTGKDIVELDNSILIKNDDDVDSYVENVSFNTKAKSLYKIDQLGFNAVVLNDPIPMIEAGQVYNSNGKVLEIGNSIYNDTYYIEVQAGSKIAGVGTVAKSTTDNYVLEGTGTSFSTQAKSGSAISVSYYDDIVTGVYTFVRSSTNFKLLTFNSTLHALSAGSKIIVGTVSRIVSSVDGALVYLTSDAPTAWGTTISSYTQRALLTGNYTVASVSSDISLTLSSLTPATALGTQTALTFEVSYVENTGSEVQTVSEKLYRDIADTTNKTLIGVNLNFYNKESLGNLRKGSKIIVDINGSDETRFVDEILSATSIRLTESFSVLTTEVVDAKVFKYSNFYFSATDTNVGSNVYFSNGATATILAQDETNTETGTMLKYLVKLTSGTIATSSKIGLAQLDTDEWGYFATYINKRTAIDNEAGYYMISFDGAYDFDTAVDIVYFNQGGNNEDRLDNYKGKGNVIFSTVAGETGTRMMVIELVSDTITETVNNYAVTGIDSMFKSGWLVTDDVTSGKWTANTSRMAEVTFIHNYEDVIIYEHTPDTAELVMVNEVVTGMTDALKERYTYWYPTNSKNEYSSIHDVSGAVISSDEFLRVFAITPGAWADADYISVAMCDMPNFANDATVEEGGITFKSLFEFAPDTTDLSLMAIAIMKNDLVIERYIVSTNPASKDATNASQYILDVINRRSNLIRVLLNTSVLSPEEPNGYDISFNTIYNTSVTGGYSGKLLEVYRGYYYSTSASTVTMDITNGHVTDADVLTAYDVFANEEEVDLGYLVDGEWCGNPVVANYIRTICMNRGDAEAILGPRLSDIVGIRNGDTIKDNMIAYVNDNSLLGGSRAFQFGGFFANCKQVYDVYNETYVWIPCSVDVAGLNNYVDGAFEPWYAVAGQQRGVVQNISKLGWNPTKTQRDAMYPNRINSIVFFKGEGTQVYGVRTLCSLKSDLADMYNRKTLNFISKNLRKFMRQVLFEFNDGATRGQVLNNIIPFLRNIQAKRGLIDFRVVCDESNNPASVIEQNVMVCDVFLKMAHVVEAVELNFIITKTSVSFDQA